MKDFDRDYFGNIDTEEKAYWLGFFYADGYVYKSGKQISICLSHKDQDHLQKFANIFKAHLKSYSYVDKRTDNEYTTVRCVVSSKQICNDLALIGVHNKKSLEGGAGILDKVPESLQHHFVRGFFDGDGCIHKNHRGEYSITFSGTKDFLHELKIKILEALSINQVKIRKEGKIYKLAWGGNWQIEKLQSWLYRDATIFLERKHSIFEKVYAGHVDKSSRHRNVSWCNTKNRWLVKKMVNGKTIHYGAFETELEAAEAASQI